MQALKAKMGRPLPHGAILNACDNSGARLLKLITVKRHKTVRGRYEAGGIGDFISASVVDGKPEMRKTVVQAIIVRQKKEFRRPNGWRVKFEDNAAVVLKDDAGNPKGTLIKGAIPEEIKDRWPAVSKIAKIIV